MIILMDRIEEIFENSFNIEEIVDYLICRETDDNPTLWKNTMINVIFL